MTAWKQLRGEDQGSQLVETALMMVVLLMLLFGIFSFAIVLFGWCNITYASRAAARYASLHSTLSLNPADDASVSAVVAPFLIAVEPSGATTQVTYSPANTIGSTVAVTVTATYSMPVPFTSLTALTVSSTAQRTITR